MTIILNGKTVSMENGTSLYDLIEKKRWMNVPMTVKVDGKIVPREDYPNTLLADGQDVSMRPYFGGG